MRPVERLSSEPMRPLSLYQQTDPWPIHWSGVWAGALSGIAMALIFGLAGIAVGAHRVGQAGQITRLTELDRGTMIFSIFGAFIAFWIAGWVVSKIEGLRHVESSMLHAALSWLVAVPVLLVLAGLGAGTFFGSWFSGLSGLPVWASSPATVDPNAAVIARNGALMALTALLVGLAGSVLGGWMGSGEPMRLTGRQNRARRQINGVHEPLREE